MSPDLSALRGLHLPTGGSGAFQGEVALAITLGFAAALLVGLARLLRARMRTSVRRAALAELARTRDLDPQGRLAAQARLLRRLVRTLDGEDAASARGPAWASVLDRTFSTDFFSRGAGRVMIDGLYKRPESSDAAAIEAELGRLLARIRA